MTVRVAIRADVPLIRRILNDYFSVHQKLSAGEYLLPTIAQMRLLLADADLVTVVDTRQGNMAQLQVERADSRVKVETLLPRGVSRGPLSATLAAAFRALIARHPSLSKWPVYAYFGSGVDADGRPDNGLGLTTAWQEVFGADILGIRENADGFSEIYTTIEPLITRMNKRGV